MDSETNSLAQSTLQSFRENKFGVKVKALCESLLTH